MLECGLSRFDAAFPWGRGVVGSKLGTERSRVRIPVEASLPLSDALSQFPKIQNSFQIFGNGPVVSLLSALQKLAINFHNSESRVLRASAECIR